MKKVLYILLAASAALILSCSKENEQPTPAAPEKTGKTITFTASMDIPFETRAALSSLNINWSDGDYVGIATDNNATIVAYPVSNISGNTCEITVDAVDGANAYYAIFRGSLGASGDAEKEKAANDFTGITFDTGTKTFSGLNVGKQQVAEGEFSSHLWYTNGFPLTMAGKSTGSTLVMKPCLALFRVQLAAQSVSGDYLAEDTYVSSYSINHVHHYSAVRGFNLYQYGGSNAYSSGDFTVQVGDGGALTVNSVDNANKGAYRQISQAAKLSSGTDYLMCLIPGGSVTSFQFDFLGYADNGGTLSWDAVYSMKLPAAKITGAVEPGNYYDLGVLNPLGRKKAANEAADEAADEAAASYVPAITIDGNLSDWSAIAASYDNSSNSRIREWRFKSDSQKVYFYLKLRKNRVDGGKNLYIGFDKDNDNATGSSYGDITGCEGYIKVIPFTNSGEGTTPEPVSGVDASSVVYASGVGTFNGSAVTMAYDDDANNPLDSNSSNIWIEISAPREQLGLPASGTITVGCSYGWGTTDKVSVTL